MFGVIYPVKRVRLLLQQRRGRLLLGLGFLAFFLAGAYAFHLISRSYRLYTILTDEQPSFTGERLRQSDLKYGYRHLPNALSMDLKMPGDTVFVYTDRDGFRVRGVDTARVNKPGEIDVLFLGCSFTYGEMCNADSIFSDRTGMSANLRTINAGVSGWGLSQMWLAAQELIPRYKPKHVVIQYSYWLPQRGISRYKTSMELSLPNPHFVFREDGGFRLRLPGYASELFDGDRNIIQPAYAGAPIRFLFEKGFGIFSREDQRRWKDRLSKEGRSGELITPHPDTMIDLCRQVYSDMFSLARNHGSVPHILYLAEWSGKPMPMDSVFLSGFDDRTLIHAVKYHEQYLREHPEMSRKWAFVHWRLQQGDTLRVDGHPNALSHRLITRSILDGLGLQPVPVR